MAQRDQVSNRSRGLSNREGESNVAHTNTVYWYTVPCTQIARTQTEKLHKVPSEVHSHNGPRRLGIAQCDILVYCTQNTNIKDKSLVPGEGGGGLSPHRRALSPPFIALHQELRARRSHADCAKSFLYQRHCGKSARRKGERVRTHPCERRPPRRKGAREGNTLHEQEHNSANYCCLLCGSIKTTPDSVFLHTPRFQLKERHCEATVTI